jgi:hypothetical protein
LPLEDGFGPNAKCVADVIRTLGTGEQRLCPGVLNSLKEVCVHRNANRCAQASRKVFSLVELALPLFERKQWNWNDEIPASISQNWFGLSAQEIKKKRFEPKCTLIFVAVNDIKGYSAGSDGGAGRKEMEIHLLAITALELRGHFAFKW